MRLVILKLRRHKVHNRALHPILLVLHTGLGDPQVKILQLLIKFLLFIPAAHSFESDKLKPELFDVFSNLERVDTELFGEVVD